MCEMDDTVDWRGMASAPRNMTIEVRHGLDDAITRARYDSSARAWVSDDDVTHELLLGVVAWRSAGPL
jgi:hypothetical protein